MACSVRKGLNATNIILWKKWYEPSKFMLAGNSGKLSKWVLFVWKISINANSMQRNKNCSYYLMTVPFRQAKWNATYRKYALNIVVTRKMELVRLRLQWKLFFFSIPKLSVHWKNIKGVGTVNVAHNKQTKKAVT